MTAKKPVLISIVTVCFNAEETIAKTIESVLSQTFGDVEYIIVDGKSTDKTCEIIARYEDKIDRFVSEKDTGIYNAMNKGAALASGEWIFFLNAGDVFVNASILQKISPYLMDEANDVVYGDILKKGKDGELFLKKSTAPQNSHKMYFCHQGVFCKTAICKKYPFDEKYALSADFKFFKQVFLNGYRFKQLDMPVTVFDTQGLSNTSRGKGIAENIRVIKETDTFADKLRLLPRLYFVNCWIRLRNLFK